MNQKLLGVIIFEVVGVVCIALGITMPEPFTAMTLPYGLIVGGVVLMVFSPIIALVSEGMDRAFVSDKESRGGQ